MKGIKTDEQLISAGFIAFKIGWSIQHRRKSILSFTQGIHLLTPSISDDIIFVSIV